MDELMLSDLGPRLLRLILDPTSDLAASLLVYGMIGIVLAILLVIAIMLVMSTDDDEDEQPPSAAGAMPLPSDIMVDSAPEDTASATPVALPPAWHRRLVSIGVGCSFVLGLWLVTGYTTSVSAVCSSCHVATAHTLSTAIYDPHVDVDCVACHESGGIPARLITNLPGRTVHILDGIADTGQDPGYGRVTQSACYTCHRTAIAQDSFNELRGIRVSHEEPLEAGATCLDCHSIYDGVIAGHNAGHAPCLRCHNQITASSDCGVCHAGDPAASASVPATFQPASLIAEVRCGGCHDEARYCDPCHGLRLPHSSEFMVYAHARQAAVDFWTNDGRLCQRCHTEARRPCTQCHTSMIGRGHGAGLMRRHQSANESSCNRCHQRWAYVPGRNFCLDVCHTPAAYRYSPR